MALVFGIMATIMAMGWLRGQSAKQQQVAVKMAPVVVAARDIGAALALTPETLTVQQWPLANRPKGGFGSVGELKDRVAGSSFGVGEPILETKLAPRGVAPGLTALVAPNKRAMTVKVDEAAGVAGFLSPDNRVDVLITVNRGDYGKDPISRIVLQDLRILGIGQRIESKPGEKPQVVPTVTLEVTPEEGERLALAAQEGHLALVLRGQKDKEIAVTSGVTVSRLLGDVGAPGALVGPPTVPGEEGLAAERPALAPPRVSAGHTVEIFRRLKKDTVNF